MNTKHIDLGILACILFGLAALCKLLVLFL